MDCKPEVTYSVPVDPAKIAEAGALTILPIRIHRDEHRALVGSDWIERDWQTAFGCKPTSFGCRSPYGHLAALSLPEAIPDRLPMCAYIMDYMLHHDDITDLDLPHAEREHQELGQDLENGPLTATMLQKAQTGSQVTAKHHLRAQMVGRLIQIDHVASAALLKEWSRYTEISAKTINLTFADFNQYADHRYYEAAIPLYFSIISFATGLILTDPEKAEVEHLLKPLGTSMAFVNDLYSFDKELAVWSAGHQTTSSDIMYNGVAYIQRERNMSIDEAKNDLRRRIVHAEGEFKKLWDEWLCGDPNPPDRLEKFVYYAALTAAGSSYWHAKAPRYQPGTGVDSNPASPMVSPTSAPTCSHGCSTGPSESIALDQAPLGPLFCSQIAHASDATLENPVYAPYTYLASLPSKGVRNLLAMAFNVWLGVPKAELDMINNIVKLLHTASLMLDDIQDRSTLRRGRPAAHVVFGEPQTINSASFLVVEGMRQVHRDLKSGSMAIYIEKLVALHEGQALDIDWRESFECPTEEEYMAMVDMKTGALFGLMVQLMQLHATSANTNDFSVLVRLLGRLFQVRDDYQNLMSRQYSEQKGFCDDLDEGKMSLPMIYTLGESRLTRKIMQFHSRSREKMMYKTKLLVLQEMDGSKALEKTKRVLESIQDQVSVAIGKLESDTGVQNPVMKMAAKMLEI